MIDILLSTYNGEAFLEKQLDSIITQTYTNWKLFIRDDGSSDTTITIIQKYAQLDNRIFLVPRDMIRLKTKKSFLSLLEYWAYDDYIMFCDQDDIWFPNKIMITLQKMEELEKVYGKNRPITIHTDLCIVNQQGEKIYTSYWQTTHILPELFDTNIHYYALCNNIAGCTMMFNQTTRLMALTYHEDTIMHDTHVVLATLQSDGIVYPIRIPTIYYRQHNQQVTGVIFQKKNTPFQKIKQWYINRQQFSFLYPNILVYMYWKVRWFLYRTRHKLSSTC